MYRNHHHWSRICHPISSEKGCPKRYTLLIYTSFSADQTIKSWRVDQQKCLRTVDISPFKNDVATSTLSKVNVSPPLIHTLAILKDGTNPRFLAVGCENGTIGLNKLGSHYNLIKY